MGPGEVLRRVGALFCRKGDIGEVTGLGLAPCREGSKERKYEGMLLRATCKGTKIYGTDGLSTAFTLLSRVVIVLEGGDTAGNCAYILFFSLSPSYLHVLPCFSAYACTRSCSLGKVNSVGFPKCFSVFVIS